LVVVVLALFRYRCAVLKDRTAFFLASPLKVVVAAVQPQVSVMVGTVVLVVAAVWEPVLLALLVALVRQGKETTVALVLFLLLHRLSLAVVVVVPMLLVGLEQQTPVTVAQVSHHL
jgi:hypothetical protein